MKSRSFVLGYYAFMGILLVNTGCASFIAKKQSPVTEKATKTVIEKKTENKTSEDTIQNVEYAFAPEEILLGQILDTYDEAIAAHQNFNYGLAEQKIEQAFMLAYQVNLDDISDTTLVKRYKDVFTVIGQEYGRILNESSMIAEEDPTSWLDEIDAEQFKSGKWTDEELRKIVMKIARKSDVPIEYNDKVRNAIYYFQNGGRKSMTNWIRRSGRYLPMIQEILQEEGLPLDLAYLSMIESGFNPKAYSRARAVGLWQFIYTTGKIYGLNRNQWIDERKDPVKATMAAAKHLNDLYETTDDWNNVMAAYNCGPTRITRHLKQTENIEFWDMQLPRETRNYVPSFMAAVVINKAPELFGFDGIEIEPPLEYDTVQVHPYTSLSNAAKCAGVTVNDLRELNPELLQNHVPPGDGSYDLKIPKNTRESFLVAYKNLPVEKYEPPRVASVRVRRGDTFSGIADRHRVSISRLRAANPQIKNINRLSIGQQINIPGMSSSGYTASSPANISSENSVSYVVKRNDTLGILAMRNNTTVRAIQSLNNMGNQTRIYVGQKLLLPKTVSIADAATQGGSLDATDIGTGQITYIIQKNDTIYEIAKRYGVDYRKLMEDNQIKNHRKIQPGQKIIVSK